MELYQMLAQLCGLLASITTALGNLGEAESLADSAFTYAEIIDQPSLCAWAKALKVAAAFWDDRPREAVKTAGDALAIAPEGTARVRLYAVMARALARLGAHDEVHTAMAHAAHELGRAGSRAPIGEQLKTGEIGARIDLGAARVLDGDLAGAEVALVPVFGLAADRRTDALTQRLHNVHFLLANRRFRGAPETFRIDEQNRRVHRERPAHHGARDHRGGPLRRWSQSARTCCSFSGEMPSSPARG